LDQSQRRWGVAQLRYLGLFTSLLLMPLSANAAITITTDLPSYYSFNSVIQGVAFQATGAHTQLSWSISAGALPPGLNLSQGGLFSGTPAKAGTYTFTVTATAPLESGNAPGTKDFSIGIPQITTPTVLPPAAVGVPYSIQFQSSDGPSTGAVWSVSLGGLPIGLTVDPHTGIYSGTPLRTGTFSLALSVSFGVAFATEQVSLTINTAGPQTLTVSPAALNFTATIGAISGAQNLAVSNTSASAVQFTVQIDDSQGGLAPGWLNVSPKGGTTPSLLHVSLVPTVLPVGTYKARIRIGLAAANASAPPVAVAVQLTISNPPPNLTAAPLSLRFRALGMSSDPENQTFLLRNTGGGAAIPFQLSVAGKSPWITAVNSSAQTISPGTPVEVTVTVNSQSLGVGSFRDAIRVTTPLAPPFDQFDVPVTITIVDQGPIMGLSLSGLRFATTQANQGSPTEEIFVEDLGSPGSAVKWTAQVVQGGGLVDLLTPQGTSMPNNPTAFGVRLSTTAASSAGGKFALIQVDDPQSQNAPQYVVVVVDVAATGTPPEPAPVPAGLFFSTASNIAPAAQQVAVNTTSASPVAFSVADSTDDGASWLAASAGSAVTSQSNPAQVSVSVSPGSLAPGIYRGTVNIAIGAIIRGVNVTLLLQAPQSAAASGAVRPAAGAASCEAAAVVLAQTGLSENFSVPAGWPATLVVEANDDCGNPLVDASVVASFSNGDPPLSLISNGQSADYSATWQPRTPASEMTVTVDAAAGSLKSAEVQLGGNVNSNSQLAPSLVSGGLLNNLNPQVGAPLAPGTVTQVYGDNLADSPDQPTAVPIPTMLKDVQVLIGALSAPLYYVSKGQLVVQIPTELAPKRTYSVVVLVGDQYTLPQNIDVTPVAPGTVAFADGTLVAQHADFGLVDASRPAKPGEPLVMYLVGMGATTPPVPSGEAAPSDPLAKVQADLEVTVDGQPAQVSFAGLTPGGVGLYQINFTVPQGVKTGKLDVVITEDGVPANVTTLIVAQ
jgi:uncharacterized protein (TIGR03437 family)